MRSLVFATLAATNNCGGVRTRSPVPLVASSCRDAPAAAAPSNTPAPSTPQPSTPPATQPAAAPAPTSPTPAANATPPADEFSGGGRGRGGRGGPPPPPPTPPPADHARAGKANRIGHRAEAGPTRRPGAGPMGRRTSRVEYPARVDHAAVGEVSRRHELRPRFHRQVRSFRATTTGSRFSTSRTR